MLERIARSGHPQPQKPSSLLTYAADEKMQLPRPLVRLLGQERGARYVTDLPDAEELLERSDLPVERVADRVGFGSATTFRQQFVKVRGISPQAYRRQFADC